jgi:hypothetical protein
MRRRRMPRPVDDQIWRATRLFIDGRLNERAVLVWAAGLGPEAGAERRAVRDAIFTRSETLAEPYLTAWRCVMESWRDGTADDPDMTVLEVSEAIGRGNDPRLYLDAIVRLASPRLKVQARSTLRPPPRGAPKRVRDLLAIDIEHDHHVRLGEIGLAECRDARVWQELLDRGEGALFAALHMADRLGMTWSANWITRVYPVDEEGDRDPDEYRSGLVAITRLVSAALRKLGEVDPTAARERLQSLRTRTWPLAKRMWAAAAANPALVDAAQLGDWLASLTDAELWHIHDYPELVELRASRYGELPLEMRAAFERRVRRGPSAKLFRRSLPKARREERKRGDAFAELRRLQRGPGNLTTESVAWLASHADIDPAWVEDDLYETGPASRTPSARKPLDLAAPDAFPQLDQALTDNPYGSGRSVLDAIAANWGEVFQQMQANPALLVHGRVVGALAFGLRDTLGVISEANPADADTKRTSEFVDLLGRVPAAARNAAASGVAYWFEHGIERLPDDPRMPALWLAWWPHAAAATNARSEPEPDWPFEDEPPSEKLSSEAANSPVGRMMHAWFSLFPKGDAALRPFEDPVLLSGRDLILATKGRAGRQALYRMLLQVRFFNRVDPAWTRAKLLGLLGEHDGVVPELWDAISRIALLPPDALGLIAEEMVRRVSDRRLTAEVRARLAERLILPAAIALADGSAPPVSLPTIEQFLRMGGTEVRSSCARALSRWLADSKSPEEHFRTAVLPVLERGWPKDRSAQSHDVADAFASLPSASQTAFPEAVAALADLLMPFDVWSLWEYRLYRRDESGRELRHPNDESEARALLTLLDRTIGNQEGDVAPHDLDVALASILNHWPKAVQDRRYQRLAALARR